MAVIRTVTCTRATAIRTATRSSSGVAALEGGEAAAAFASGIGGDGGDVFRRSRPAITFSLTPMRITARRGC